MTRNKAKQSTEYIYLLRDRFATEANLPLYKIGRTVDFKTRSKSYNKFSTAYLVVPVADSKVSESILLAQFRAQFKHRTDCGAEWFEGNVTEMARLCLAHSLANIDTAFAHTPRQPIVQEPVESTVEIVNIVQSSPDYHTLHSILYNYTRDELLGGLPPLGSIIQTVESAPHYTVAFHYSERAAINEAIIERPYLDCDVLESVFKTYLDKLSDTKFYRVLSELLWIIYNADGSVAVINNTLGRVASGLATIGGENYKLCINSMQNTNNAKLDDTTTETVVTNRGYKLSHVVGPNRATPFDQAIPGRVWPRVEYLKIGSDAIVSDKWARLYTPMYYAWNAQNTHFAVLNSNRKLVISADCDPAPFDTTGWTIIQVSDSTNHGCPGHLSFVQRMHKRWTAAGYTRYKPTALEYIS